MTKLLKLITLITPLLFLNTLKAKDKSSGCGLGWKVSKRMSITSSSVRLSTNFGMNSMNIITIGMKFPEN